MNRTTQETVMNDDSNGITISDGGALSTATTNIPGPQEAAQLIWYHLAHAPMVSDEDRAKLNAYAHDVYDRAATKPAPDPWTLIPEGRENAAVLRVNGVVGTYFRDEDEVYLASLTGAFAAVGYVLSTITSVEPVQVVPEGARVLGEDEVAVPRESLGVLRRAKHATRLGPDQGWLATALDDLYDDLPGDLAAVEGGGDQ